MSINPNEKYFCVVPFVQLNTRGKGDARVCCSIDFIDKGIPKHLTIDQVNKDTYTNDTEVFNLHHDQIKDLWNSKFMKDFRLKMIKGEYIPACHFCHKMEESGLTSKRLSKNKIFLDNTKPLLQKYYENQGFVDIMPQWWEIRLSTKCNLSCVMCSPVLSSMMAKEYKKWGEKAHKKMKGGLKLALENGEEYLSKSDFFKNQILENLEHVVFMEFRGGEVFSDRESIDFIKKITESEYAKNIKLDISTNATLITDEVIEILNCFAGGKLKYSIDAGPKYDHLIRYHTKFDDVLKSMKNGIKLHQGWIKLTQTTLQVLNATIMYDFLIFLDNFCYNNKEENLILSFTTVRGKDYLRHELVPYELRKKEIKNLENFIKTSYLCNQNKHKSYQIQSVKALQQVLSNEQNYDVNLKLECYDYFKSLSELREEPYIETFPILEEFKNALP